MQEWDQSSYSLLLWTLHVGVLTCLKEYEVLTVYILLLYVLFCSAVTLHSVPVSEQWQQEDAHFNYKTITSLQSCSEYEFKVQVLVQGQSPGPFSAALKVKTQKARK